MEVAMGIDIDIDIDIGIGIGISITATTEGVIVSGRCELASPLVPHNFHSVPLSMNKRKPAMMVPNMMTVFGSIPKEKKGEKTEKKQNIISNELPHTAVGQTNWEEHSSDKHWVCFHTSQMQ